MIDASKTGYRLKWFVATFKLISYIWVFGITIMPRLVVQWESE